MSVPFVRENGFVDVQDMWKSMQLNVCGLEGNFACTPYLREAVRGCREICEKLQMPFMADALSLCAFAYPHLPEKEFYVACYVQMFVGLMDDLLDDSNKDANKRISLIQELVKCLKSGVSGSQYSNITAFAIEVVARIENDCLRAFVCHYVRDYLEAIASIIKGNDRVMTPDDYVKLRLSDLGCFHSWGLLFLDKADFEPYREFLESDLGKKASQLAGTSALLINDVVSLKKDKRMNAKFNMVFSLVQHRSMTEECAVDHVLKMAKDAYNELEKMTSDQIGNEVIKRLLLCCRGFNMWSVSTPRYY